MTVADRLTQEDYYSRLVLLRRDGRSRWYVVSGSSPEAPSCDAFAAVSAPLGIVGEMGCADLVPVHHHAIFGSLDLARHLAGLLISGLHPDVRAHRQRRNAIDVLLRVGSGSPHPTWDITMRSLLNDGLVEVLSRESPPGNCGALYFRCGFTEKGEAELARLRSGR